jgi:hypothetical protein
VSRRIIVRVSPTGGITVEAECFQGKGCEAATKAIEEALGKPKERARKPDYWRQAQARANTNNSATNPNRDGRQLHSQTQDGRQEQARNGRQRQANARATS